MGFFSILVRFFYRVICTAEGPGPTTAGVTLLGSQIGIYHE
jgi:hypothetical protein